MKVIDPGHVYELTVLDDEPPRRGLPSWHDLIFVKREGPKFPGNVGHHSGTTVQEVLRAVHNRLGYVNSQVPCWQTRLTARLIYWSVWLLEHRAAKRHGRTPPLAREALFGRCCSYCNHVGCGGECHARKT